MKKFDSESMNPKKSEPFFVCCSPAKAGTALVATDTAISATTVSTRNHAPHFALTSFLLYAVDREHCRGRVLAQTHVRVLINGKIVYIWSALGARRPLFTHRPRMGVLGNLRARRHSPRRIIMRSHHIWWLGYPLIAHTPPAPSSIRERPHVVFGAVRLP